MHKKEKEYYWPESLLKKKKKNIDRKKKRKLLKEQKETKSFFLDLYPKNGELCPFAIIINYIDPLCAKAILLY